jgi:flagellin-like protein
MKVLSSRKGVTPVITTLLIIVIVVAAAVLVSFLVADYMGGTLNKAEEKTMQSTVYISNVVLKQGTNDTLILTIRNIGDAKATVNKVYINETEAEVSGAGEIPQGSTVDIEAKSSVAFEFEKRYTIEVVCTNGQYCTETWTRRNNG